MKLHLDKIESQVEEQLVIASEDLLLDESRQPMQEVEKNLWLGKYEGKEVEVQTYGRKIRKYTCECEQYFKTKICKHSIASFLDIRKKKPAPAARKKIIKKPTPPQRLTVSTIINNVGQDELVRFLASYARKDQQFTNFLKTRFATRVVLPDTRDKYANLLGTMIRSNQSANLSFSRGGAKKIHDLLNILIEEIEDEFRGENYLEVFEAFRCIIEKVTPVLSRLTAHRGDLVTTLEKVYLMIIKMLKEPISPELRLKIANFFVVIIRQRYFHFSKIEKLFLTAFKSIISIKDAEELLMSHLEVETDKKYHNRALEAKIFLFYFITIENEKDRDERLKAKLINRQWLLLNSVELANKYGYFSIVYWLTDFGFNDKKYRNIHGNLDEIRLQIALNKEEGEAIALFAAKRILTTLNPSYFEYFRDEFSDGAKEINSLIERIEVLPESENRTTLLAELFLSEKNEKSLFNLFEKSDNLTVFAKYSVELFEKDKKKTQELAWQKIDIYLQNHVGEPAVRGARSFIKSLYQAGSNKLAIWVTRKIREEYKSRKLLISEIMIFR